MVARKTYCFKLYRSHRNKKLHKQINAGGMAYNHCIALHKRYYRLFHNFLNVYQLQKHLTKIKKIEKFSYLREIGSQVLQDIASRIDKGYKLFFRNLKCHVKTAPPRFRKVKKAKSFTLKQAGWKLEQETRTLIIGKQKYRYHKSREIEGNIKTVTIKRDACNDIYVYFSCECEQNEVIPRLGKSIGFDFGFKSKMLIAPTEADDIDMPKFFKRNLKAIAKANQNLSWKKKGSNNQRKANQELSRLHRRIKNQRKAKHWELAYELCGKYATICIESLNMKFMQKGHGRKVNDYGYSNFLQILEYVGSRCGTTIVKIDKWYPSSQICHDCGYQNQDIKNLNIREWDCPECGVHHDRDRNAARNILSEGLRTLEESA